MTLKPLTLEQYFHTIIKQPPKKEQTMMLKLSMFFTEQFEKLNSLLNKPVSFVQEDDEEGSDYYIFEMYTAPWYDPEAGKVVDSKRSLVIGDQVGDEDPSWTSVLDKILDEMSKHYGYDLKSQVYYSVTCPINDIYPEKAGRMLNDEVLQQLLLAFPEVYERDAQWNKPKNVFE